MERLFLDDTDVLVLHNPLRLNNETVKDIKLLEKRYDLNPSYTDFDPLIQINKMEITGTITQIGTTKEYGSNGFKKRFAINDTVW